MTQRAILGATLLVAAAAAGIGVGASARQIEEVQVIPAQPAMPQRGGGPGVNQLPPPTGTALIVGQVVDGSTGRPVAGAIVSLNGSASVTPPTGQGAGTAPNHGTTGTGLGAGTGSAGISGAGGQSRTITVNGQTINVSGMNQQVPVQRVMTDGDGRFMFHDLPKGTFNLNASATGYTGGGYGQRKPNGPSRSLDLDNGQRFPDATLRIWKLGAITGTVVDEFGDPLVNVNVRVLRRTIVNGQRRLTPGNSAQTDDRGIYRFGTLTPGDYVVAVPSTTTSVPTSLVDQYQQMIMSQGNGQPGQDIGQKIQTFMMDLQTSGAPIPAGAGYKVGNDQVQPGNALARLAPRPTDTGRIMVYQTEYYPSSTTSTQAQVITLGSGDERSGVDLQLRLVATSRVSGTLSGPDGPAAGIGLKLIPMDARDYASDNGYETSTTATDGAGQFTFLGVPVGQYVLRAQKVPRPQPMAPPPPPPMSVNANGVARVTAPPAQAQVVEPTLWAETSVTVAEADVSNVQVTFRNGIRVNGRLEFDGALPRPTADRLQQMTINFTPVDPRSGFPNQPTRVHPDGGFTSMEYLPGKYWINASGSPGPGWIVKSIMANGRDANVIPLSLEGSDLSGVVITYTDKQTQLSGVVQGTNGSPEPNGFVLIMPMNYQAWIDNGMSSRATRQTHTGSDGTYKTSVLPGDYLVVAISDELANDWQDPAVVADLARFGARITVAEGEKKTQDLRLSQVR